jgi:hypothetical protein
MPEATYDFSSPYCAVSIVLPDGTNVPLWTNANFSAGDNLLLSLAVVTEVTVEMQLAYLPKITVTMNLPLSDLIDFIDSDLIVWGSSYLQVQLGYIGGTSQGPVLSPVFTGLLMKPDVQLGADPTITLVGYGTGGFDMLNSSGRGVALGPDTRRNIIKSLLAGPDPNNPRPITLDDSRVTSGSDEQVALDTPDEIAPGWQNDWFQIWRLARICHCWIVQVGNNMLQLVPRSIHATDTPKYVFAFFPGVSFGPGANTSSPTGDQKTLLPVLGLSTNSWGALFLPKGAGTYGQIMKGINSETGDPYAMQIASALAPGAQGTPQTIAQSGQGNNEPAPNPERPAPNAQTGDGMEPGNADQPTTLAQQQAKGELTAMQPNMGIKIEVDTLGVPNLFPGDLIELQGVGKRLGTDSGEYVKNYAIFTVTHTFNGSGLSTSFTAVSNVGSMFDRGQKQQGPVGTTDADAQSSGSTSASPTSGSGSS